MRLNSINLEGERVRKTIFPDALLAFDGFTPQGDTRNVIAETADIALFANNT